MAERTYAESLLAGMLTRRGLKFSEQEKVAGHKIDFTVHFPGRDVLLDVNGDRWHHWSKIVDCDRIKLNRVLEAERVPLAVWLSRLQKNPTPTMDAIAALEEGPERLPWWDWAVDLRSLSPAAEKRAAQLLGEREMQCR